MIVEHFGESAVICDDSTSQPCFDFALALTGGRTVRLIIADPPYGNVLSDGWDRTKLTDDAFSAWMVDWTQLWSNSLVDGGAFYVWGGTGSPGFRPFFKFLTNVERRGRFELSNLITWKKKRGYGTQSNYLYTREELAYFVNGDAKKPAMFNVPYLEEIRGYPGFNKKYPAKDARYRRTNVWTDITEVMQGKRHVAQKKLRLLEIPMEVHTATGDWVIDPFGGSGTTAEACIKLKRKFIIIEKDENIFRATVDHLREIKSHEDEVIDSNHGHRMPAVPHDRLRDDEQSIDV